MEKIKIDRINELGRLSKTRELTEEERAEQAILRKEYLAEFRAALRGETVNKNKENIWEEQMKNCAVCQSVIESDDAAVLCVDGYGNKRYLCAECEEIMDTVTLGKDYTEICEAINEIGKRMVKADITNKFTLKTVEEIIKNAKSRAELIKDGSYDFSLDTEVSDIPDTVPEQLLETEEDKEADRVEAEKNKKVDFWVNIVFAVLIAGCVGFFLYKVLSPLL